MNNENLTPAFPTEKAVADEAVKPVKELYDAVVTLHEVAKQDNKRLREALALAKAALDSCYYDENDYGDMIGSYDQDLVEKAQKAISEVGGL